jgi:hypothetical protein
LIAASEERRVGLCEQQQGMGNPESASLTPDKLASAFLTGSGGSTRMKQFKWKSEQVVERRKA